MSKFSGKCDFGDSVLMFSSPEEMIKKEIYINDHLLKFENVDDLIPYYPYLVSSSSSNVYHLCSKSFVDEEETEFIGYIIRDAIKLYKRAKLKKIDFTLEFCLKSGFSLSSDILIWWKVVEALKEHPVIATYPIKEFGVIEWIRDKYFADIHTTRATWYREQLLDYAAETSFGEFYKLRGDNYYNAIAKYRANKDAQDNLVNSYFGSYDKTLPVATDLTQDKYKFNFELHKVMHKVNDFQKLLKEYSNIRQKLGV